MQGGAVEKSVFVVDDATMPPRGIETVWKMPVEIVVRCFLPSDAVEIVSKAAY